ncbi:unnamed protein product [marine sediment metagenome]|uniref:Uncharacterized protein n=1 Tax=marine sediment metagenome TaxID=412755 RepID=X1UCI3_9ZZZZ
MRLNKYLIEGTEFDQSNLDPDMVVKQIKHFCKDYLKLLKGKQPLWRGIYSISKIGNKPVRTDRNAKGTSEDAFKFVNKWLSKKGWPRRDRSVICTSNKSWADDFGNPRMIFPVEMKGYAWIESRDFNDHSFSDKAVSKGGTPKSWDIGTLEWMTEYSPDENRYDRADKYLQDFVHGNKHFDIAYNRQYEMWFDCKRYYYLSIAAMDGEEQNQYIRAFKKAGIKVK